ncbi:MAG TPA: hypothetical protein VJ997_02580 [Longimicrobiales bacterium]|nr:hypothetical protein [Longimicrobiales bacterium]
MVARLTARLGLAFMLAAGVAGCSSAGGGRAAADPFAGGGASSRQADRQVQVQVENQNFNQATITARGPAIRRQLGRVSGMNEGRFSLPWSTSSRLYFEIEFLGGGGCTTRMVQVDPGSSIRVIIDSVSRIRADGVSRMCDVERGR